MFSGLHLDNTTSKHSSMHFYYVVNRSRTIRIGVCFKRSSSNGITEVNNNGRKVSHCRPTIGKIKESRAKMADLCCQVDQNTVQIFEEPEPLSYPYVMWSISFYCDAQFIVNDNQMSLTVELLYWISSYLIINLCWKRKRWKWIWSLC